MLVAEFQQYFFGITIALSSLFLVMLVLVQRGRGGGLTGALGGAGGQSAFGTKAGDLFTRITVAVAAVWIFLCAAAVFFLRDRALPQTGVMDRDIPAAVGDAPSGLELTPPATTTTPATPTETPAATTTETPASTPAETTTETPAAATDQPAAAQPAASGSPATERP